MSRPLIIITVLSIIVFFANSWGPSVYILDEAKNAGCAMEMYQRGDWVVPTFNDALRTDKPPLHYYFMKMAYSILGINPFAARFFSSVMGVLLVLTVYVFTRRFLNEMSALAASLILLSSIHITIQFHLAVPDPYLIFFLALSLFLFYDGFKSGKRLRLMTSYASLALATLAKGPVAIIFYGLIVLIFLLAIRAFSWKELRRLYVPQGVLLFLLLVLPWYVAVGIETQGVWLEQFFFKHNVGRFTATMEGHRGFPLSSVVILILGLMPFSFFFPQMMNCIWTERQNHFLLLCVVVVLVVVIFFSLSRTILPTYMGPAFPFFSILLGYYGSTIINNSTNLNLFAGAIVFAVIAAAMPVTIWFVLRNDTSLSSLSYLWVYFLPLVAGALLAIFFLAGQKIKYAAVTYMGSFIIFGQLFFYIVFPRIDATNPVSQSISFVKEANAVACYQNMNPAFVFGLKHPVPTLNDWPAVRDFLNQPGSLIITEKKFLKKIDGKEYSILFEMKDLFENPTTMIIGAPR
jgi:4-amino-4-deoxy-L-arabinose transferase-like glycosyltransferase